MALRTRADDREYLVGQFLPALQDLRSPHSSRKQDAGCAGMKRPKRSYGSKPMTKAQNEASFRMWLSNCRDKALDWPADQLARSYGMKLDDVTAMVAAERAERARRNALV